MRVGVDIGGTKVEALVVEGERDIRGRGRSATPASGGAEAIVDAVAAVVAVAMSAAGVGQVTGVGLGSPGAVDEETGTVARAANLAGGWVDPYPFAETLSQRLGAPVRVANDVEAAVGAEVLLGAGRELESFLGIWWGTGVGGSVVLNGKRWAGNGAAGELGHMVVKLDGRRCLCGRKGCLEAYAGRGAMELRARRLHEEGRKTHLFALAAKHGRDRLSSSIWERALDAGDELAHELVDEAYAALAATAASVSNLLDLDGFVLGGGLGTRFGDRAARRIREEMAPHLFSAHDPRVVPSELGDDGGALGAALLVTG
jgi:glucokinase